MNGFVAATVATIAGTVAGIYYAGMVAALWAGVLSNLQPVLG